MSVSSSEIISNLPRDIKFHIIKFLDIESRRILNIYSKLKIPSLFINKLNSIPRINYDNTLHIFYLNLLYNSKIVYRFEMYLLFKTIKWIFHVLNNNIIYGYRYHSYKNKYELITIEKI